MACLYTVYILCEKLCADVTRVLVLDESQGRTLSQTVAKLLKEFGQQEAKKNFSVSATVILPQYC